MTNSYILQLPARAKELQAIKSSIEILEDLVHSPNKKGLQLLVLHLEDWLDWDTNEKIISENISQIPDEYKLTLHAPIFPFGNEELVNLYGEKGRNTLDTFCKFAAKHGIRNIIAHTNSIHMPNEQINLQRYTKIKQGILNNLLWVAEKNPNVNIGIENIPQPHCAPCISDPDKLPYECFMTSDLDIIDFTKAFSCRENLGFCIDATHYEMMRATINNTISNYGATPSRSKLKETGCLGRFPSLTEQIELIDLIKQIKKLGGKIFDLQISGYDGSVWKAHKENSVREGLVLNEQYGKKMLSVAKEINKLFPDTPISFDIECEKYVNRKDKANQEKSVQYFLKNI